MYSQSTYDFFHSSYLNFCYRELTSISLITDFLQVLMVPKVVWQDRVALEMAMGRSVVQAAHFHSLRTREEICLCSFDCIGMKQIGWTTGGRHQTSALQLQSTITDTAIPACPAYSVAVGWGGHNYLSISVRQEISEFQVSTINRELEWKPKVRGNETELQNILNPKTRTQVRNIFLLLP